MLLALGDWFSQLLDRQLERISTFFNTSWNEEKMHTYSININSNLWLFQRCSDVSACSVVSSWWDWWPSSGSHTRCTCSQLSPGPHLRCICSAWTPRGWRWSWPSSCCWLAWGPATGHWRQGQVQQVAWWGLWSWWTDSRIQSPPSWQRLGVLN